MKKYNIFRAASKGGSIAIFLILCISLTARVYGQYYPMPNPIDRSQEKELEKQLRRNIRDTKKAEVLLKLANIHAYKPLKDFKDFPLAKNYAMQAERLSKSIGNVELENAAMFSLASTYILEDSLLMVEKMLPRFKDPKTKNDLMLGLAFTFIFCPERPLEDVLGKGKLYAQNALEESLKLENKKNELCARQYLGFVHFLEGKEECITELNDVIRAYSSNKIDGVQYAYAILADIHWSQGKYAEALNDTKIAIDATDKSNDKIALADLYSGLSTIYLRASEYDKYNETLQLALDNYKKRISRYTAQNIISSVSARMIKLHKSSAALKYLNAQHKIFLPITFDQKRVMVNAYANCYLALEQYQKAEQYFLEEFRMIKNAGWSQAGNYSGMGYFYIEHKEYQKAKPFLLQAVKMQDKQTDVYIKRHLTYMLFLADSALGNYQSAIRYLKQNKILDDSAENTKKRADVQKLLVQFESQKKEAQIKDFKQRETLNSVKEERASLIKNIILGVAIIFLLLAMVFYRQYKQKKVLSEEITDKNVRQELLLNQLNRVIKEKEWLLKEVHHRVKNNLHTVMCLLESQAVYLESDALKAVEDSKHRIFAMSLIHQRLYETENSKTIDLQSYIYEFVGYLKDSFVMNNNVHFNLEIEPVVLDVAVAIPLALVINEAVTNSIKHAFKGKNFGEISISLYVSEENLNLKISDNGIGLDQSKEKKRKGSLGMKLIEGLSEDLNGTVRIESVNGTSIYFVCNINPFKEDLALDSITSA